MPLREHLDALEGLEIFQLNETERRSLANFNAIYNTALETLLKTINELSQLAIIDDRQVFAKGYDRNTKGSRFQEMLSNIRELVLDSLDTLQKADQDKNQVVIASESQSDSITAESATATNESVKINIADTQKYYLIAIIAQLKQDVALTKFSNNPFANSIKNILQLYATNQDPKQLQSDLTQLLSFAKAIPAPIVTSLKHVLREVEIYNGLDQVGAAVNPSVIKNVQLGAPKFKRAITQNKLDLPNEDSQSITKGVSTPPGSSGGLMPAVGAKEEVLGVSSIVIRTVGLSAK